MKETRVCSLPGINSEIWNIAQYVPLWLLTVSCVTYRLSSVSLFAERSDRSRGTRGSWSSGGATRTSVTSLSLQEDTRWLLRMTRFSAKSSQNVSVGLDLDFCVRLKSLTLTPRAPSLPGGPSDPAVPWDTETWFNNIAWSLILKSKKWIHIWNPDIMVLGIFLLLMFGSDLSTSLSRRSCKSRGSDRSRRSTVARGTRTSLFSRLSLNTKDKYLLYVNNNNNDRISLDLYLFHFCLHESKSETSKTTNKNEP